MKYLKEFNNHDAYAAFIVGANFITPNVLLCNNEKHVHYNPYIPPVPVPELLDILYSDTNGNLSFTSEVLPVSEGKTPIGLCIAPTGFFGENEKARWMSLKYMNTTTPETGTLSTTSMIYWGNYGTDINTIDNIQITHIGGTNYSYLTAEWITGTTDKIPSLFDENNNWNISVLGTVNQYAVTDIDGKNKTDKILATATAQATWQTDTSIIDNSGANYAPAACCCARYHTLGTHAGDWYIGAVGEMSIIVVKRNEINEKLAAINTIYSNDCITNINYGDYLTSTEYNNNSLYLVNTSMGDICSDRKNSRIRSLAILQY